jgi:hypothetical protein
MKLGMLIADTLPDKRAARFAVERTLSELPLDDCLLLSDCCFVDGARHVAIPPLRGLCDYNRLVLDELVEHLACDAYLVIQWDGFVVDGACWQPAFLDHDYIGAPWPDRADTVGAGGFSLRSRRLFDAVRDLRRSSTQRDVHTAEDLQICVTHRAALRGAGVRFASAATARRFAFERTHDAIAARDAVPRTLGFHGVFNFPRVLAEETILALFDAIVPRIAPSWPAWHLFIWHAWERGYETLGMRLLSALADRDPRLWAQVVRACVTRGVPRRWLRAA